MSSVTTSSASGAGELSGLSHEPDVLQELITAARCLLDQPACRLQVSLVDAVQSLPHILRLGAFLTRRSEDNYASEHSQHRYKQGMGSTHRPSVSELQRFLCFFRKAFNAATEAPGFELKYAVLLLSGLKDAFFLIMSTLHSANKQPHAPFLDKYLPNGPVLVCLEVLPAVFRLATLGLQSGLSDLVKSLDQDFISEYRCGIYKTRAGYS